MKLTFWGAARQVTGSMFLLELSDGYKILIDCGADLSRKSISEPLFGFRPSEIDLVILTHAHFDHSGNIPNLLIQGYKGQILCTPATQDLAEIILKDSASIHGQTLKQKGKNLKPLKSSRETRGVYFVKQVDEAIEQFINLKFEKRFEVRDDLFITFIPAGHLLGAASVLLEVKEGEEWKKIIFTGDIGRKNYPIIGDPKDFPQVDFIVCETTYGIRKHKDEDLAEEILQKIVEEACVKIPGRLIIPAFSVGRTQSILYTLHKLYKQGKLPSIKIFADSPMAEESTKVYERYPDLWNQEAVNFQKENRGLFDFENLTIIQTAKESKEISNYTRPCIIISSSGMITGGRIENHLKNNLANPYCTVLMVGYVAEGTPGHQLLHQKTVNIKGRNLPVTAKVISTDIFSGHADQDDLLAIFKNQEKDRLKKIFLVHGEYESMIGFKKLLNENKFERVEIPKKGENYEL